MKATHSVRLTVTSFGILRRPEYFKSHFTRALMVNDRKGIVERFALFFRPCMRSVDLAIRNPVQFRDPFPDKTA